MTVTDNRPEVSPQGADDLTERSVTWLADFERAITSRDVALFRDMFLEQSYWRDMVSFTWTMRQWHGRDAIEADIFDLTETTRPSGLRLDPARPAPAVNESSGAPLIEIFFDFKTAVGYAKGLANLVPDESSPWGMRVLWFNTVLYGLDGVEEAPFGKNDQRHPRTGYTPSSPEKSWGDHQRERTSYETNDPEVLVIGGGQSGVSIAARLDRMGVDVLVVEKNERAGDNWRNRYETLALHTPTDMADLPFLEFPKSFPKYLPKDKMGDYLESYVTLMDFPYWTSSEVQSARFDEKTGQWEAQVRREDGTVRTMHPKHVIMAVGGIGGQPKIPHIDGIEKFKGNVIHSTNFKTAKGYAGKRVLVVGTATSAHDIALDLYRHDAAYVALGQRSATSVVDIETANLVYGLYFDPNMPQEEADQRFSASYIWPLMAEGLKAYVDYVVEPTHAEMFAKLEAAGLRLDQGEDGLGWMGKYLSDAGRYYLNVGASDVIIEGGIKVLQFSDFDDFVAEGVRLKDGTIVELDEIILATGFQNLSSDVESLFGPEVAQKVGRIGGIGDDGEPRNMVQPTGQEHLWFIFGGIADARKATPWLALQIKANLAGIVPSFRRNPDGSLTSIDRR